MVAFLHKENMELRHKVVKAATYSEGESSRKPSKPTSGDKGKQVIVVEELNVPEQSRRTRTRSTTKREEKMKETLPAIENAKFDEWKEYHKLFEQI